MIISKKVSHAIQSGILILYVKHWNDNFMNIYYLKQYVFVKDYLTMFICFSMRHYYYILK